MDAITSVCSPLRRLIFPTHIGESIGKSNLLTKNSLLVSLSLEKCRWLTKKIGFGRYVLNYSDEVMKRGVEHLVKDHGMREEDITPGMKDKVRKLIHTS